MYETQFTNRIEKIKIIGSTFMAASGLISGRKNSQDLEGDTSTEPFSRAQNARILVRFSAAMMRSIEDVDYTKFQLSSPPDFKLRVGISTGKVIAGVVGAQKPLYDIWGNTVNVASRMDYTGERGKIHLPEQTAFELMNKDSGGAALEPDDTTFLDTTVLCRYRGEIDVKGKGIMKTYFVELTEDLHPVEEGASQGDRLTVRVEMEDEPSQESPKYLIPREMLEKIESKKDSGFGSQGALEVDNIKVRMTGASPLCSLISQIVPQSEEPDRESEPEPEPEPRVLAQLSVNQLRDHYEVYEERI